MELCTSAPPSFRSHQQLGKELDGDLDSFDPAQAVWVDDSTAVKGSDNAKDFDAVVVSTAEHTHALATYLALTHGKHVYCEKPLAYNIWETRLIHETAAKNPKLSTQMGNQGHASPARRMIKEILDTGVIGPVRDARNSR